MENEVRKCNCPYCFANKEYTRDILEKDGALKCHGCGETYFISLNENNEIDSSKEYHYKRGAGRAFCNCPQCGMQEIVSREDAQNNDGRKCVACGCINIACLNHETNTIELQPVLKRKRFTHDNKGKVLFFAIVLPAKVVMSLVIVLKLINVLSVELIYSFKSQKMTL